MAEETVVGFGENTARRLNALVNGGLYSETGPGFESLPLEVASLMFRNDSGEEIPPWGAMKVTDATMEDGKAIVVVDKPEAISQILLFNGARAVADGNRGVAQSGPVYRVTYTGTAPTNGRVVGHINGQWYLDDAAGGFIVIGEVSADADTMFVMEHHEPMAGKSNGTITAGSTGTVHVYTNLTDDSYDITASLDWMDGGTNISNDKELEFQWKRARGKFQILWAECE